MNDKRIILELAGCLAEKQAMHDVARRARDASARVDHELRLERDELPRENALMKQQLAKLKRWKR